MRHHYTTDPDKRAAHIAEREASAVFRKTHDLMLKLEEGIQVFEQALLELAGR